MAHESEKFKASRPAARAREMLGEALGQIQDIRGAGLDVNAVTASIARAVGALYAVQSSDPSEPGHAAGVSQSMDHLREALARLQDVRSDEPALVHAATTIARTLAVLYPVSKVQERQSICPDRPPSIIHGPVADDPRRTARRVAIEADIGFQSDTNFYTGFSEDISVGGIFIATFDTRPIGSKLHVNFTLPDGHMVSTAGVVRWIREYRDDAPDMHPGMGVQFESLSPIDRGAIDAFLDLRQPLFFEE